MSEYKDGEYRPIAGPLYHYTSIDALISIVEHKTLRATNIYYMNDASESDLGLGLIKQAAEEARKTATDLAFLDYVVWWIDNRYIFNLGAVYVLCFSEACNQLSQWRGYTPHGRGVCLGLDPSILVNRMQEIGGRWTFHSCRYTESSQRAFAQAILTRMRREASARDPSVDPIERYGAVLSANASEVMQVAAIMKNASFSEEKEVRFISPAIRNDDPRLKFRAGKSSLMPYIEFKLVDDVTKPLGFADVWIGPSPHQRLTHIAITSLVERYKFALTVNYRSTEIPYREI